MFYDSVSTTFYCVLFYLYALTFVMLKSLIALFINVWNLSDPKGKFPVFAFITNNSFLYCVCSVQFN